MFPGLPPARRRLRALRHQLRRRRRLIAAALTAVAALGALRTLAEGLEPGLRVGLHLPETLPPLTAASEVALYRIAQEALTNVSRHARATHAWVELSSHHGLVHLLVADDGVGAHGGDQLDPRRGSGLVGIDERVSGLGGRWSLSDRSEGGAVLHVELNQRAVAPA